MSLKTKRILFIGGGKMAEAIIRGLVSSGSIPQKNVFVSDPLKSRVLELRKLGSRATTDNHLYLAGAEVIVLAVKPQVIGNVLSEIGPKARADQLIVSIAAGISISGLAKYFRKSPIVRVMPNNPALIGEAMSAIAAGPKVSSSQLKLVEEIFGSIGETVLLEEKFMNAATALSGSGPGFVYFFAEALISAGKAAGLPASSATKMAIKTILGSAKAMSLSGKSPEKLKKMVCSPKGTTLKGLRVLEKRGLRSAVVEAVNAAAKRAEELGKIYNP